MLAVEIIVKGWVDPNWAEWLGGLEMTHSEPDQTILTGELPDQAAVYGIIARLRDLGLELSSASIDEYKKDI
ncbi:hypothetical protein AMJ86_04545 [bacterium SM23_57]|jgi:hypothetical protein|nr:MAG: hypothetical protein AMJ86_04545 [bacterium SM23_57]